MSTELELPGKTDLGQYDYWLNSTDVHAITSFYYKFNGKFEIVGSMAQLNVELAQYKKSEDERPCLIIFNEAQNHWYALVLAKEKSQYCVIYANSFGTAPTYELQKTVKNLTYKLIDVSSRQQFDGHNCGFWAIENGIALCEAVTRGCPLSSRHLMDELPMSRTSQHFNSKRKDAANSLRR